MITMTPPEAKYLLLTGATGLLGRYLMKDLLIAGVPLAVLVRPSRKQTAEERVESLMRFWEEELGRQLPRPKVLSGELCEDSLGLEPRDIRWAAENCSGLIHNAASLSFVSTGRDAEPYRTNVDGTKNVLQFCQEAGIRDFHHVSTAYVCGLRTGKCLESELDVGQEFGNPYEESKVEAEKMVRESKFIDNLTVYRPGIIVGDSETGFTNTFHGFYAAVQLVYTINAHSDTSTKETGHCDRNPSRVNLNGNESKNFVPVEWVSAVMSHVISNPEHHNKTYHLTPRNPVTTRTVHLALQASAKFYGSELCGDDLVLDDPVDVEKFFYEHIRIYNSYWRNDPEFDYTNTRTAAPHLPCPYIDYHKLVFMARKAIEMNFMWRDKTVKLERKQLVAN
ncbi:MAG: SDR family oxidoreductase [Rubinisphaera brasiliensis]|uniref:SDR family oxidoreductase n=1 Tax=Rubinisphaera TaxID=1649490 RepID=UPI001F413B2B|nr:SDR family oxidoreductase [Rubinisphaera sp. JC750]